MVGVYVNSYLTGFCFPMEMMGRINIKPNERSCQFKVTFKNYNIMIGYILCEGQRGQYKAI